MTPRHFFIIDCVICIQTVRKKVMVTDANRDLAILFIFS